MSLPSELVTKSCSSGFNGGAHRNRKAPGPAQNEAETLPCSADVLLKNLRVFGDATVHGLDWGCWKDHWQRGNF